MSGDRFEPQRVEHLVGVCREGLVAVDPALRSQVDRSGANEDNGVEVRVAPGEYIEQDPAGLHVLDA